MDLHVKRVAAKDAEPKEGNGRRHEHHTDHELPDRPAARNARDEHPDKRCPGNPPTPVEDGSAALPGFIPGFTGDPEAHQPFCQAGKEEERDEDDAEIDIPFGNNPDAVSDTRYCGKRRSDGNQRDQNNLYRNASVDPDHDVDRPGVETQ